MKQINNLLDKIILALNKQNVKKLEKRKQEIDKKIKDLEARRKEFEVD